MADPPLHLSARAQVPLRPQVLPDAVGPSAVSPKVAEPPTGNPSAHGFQGINASPVPGAPLRNSSCDSLVGGTLSHGVCMSNPGLSVALAGVQSRSDLSFVPPPQLTPSSGAPESGENSGRALRETLLSPSAACGVADAQVGQQATPPACRLAGPARNAGTAQAVGQAPTFRPQTLPGAPVQNGLQIRANAQAQGRIGPAENSPADGVGSRLSASSSATLPPGRLHAARSPFATTGGSHPGVGIQEAPETIQVPVASGISSNSSFPMAAASSLDSLSSPEKLSLPLTINRITSAAPPSSLARPQAAQPLLRGVHAPDGQGRSGGPLPVQPVSSSALAAASVPSRPHAVSIPGTFSLNRSPTSAPPAASGPPRALAGLHASNVFTGNAVAGAVCAPTHQFAARAPVPSRQPVSTGSSALATISSSCAAASTAPSGSRPAGVSSDAAKTPNPVTAAVVNSHSASGVAALPRFTSPFSPTPARSLSAAGPPGDSSGAPNASVSPSASAVVAAKRRVLPPGGQPGATAASHLANFAPLGAQAILPAALNRAATVGAGAGSGAGGGPSVTGPNASCPVRYGSLGSSVAAGVQVPRGSQGPARLSRGQSGGPTLTHASGRPSPAAKVQCSRSECSSPHALLSSTPSPPGSPSLRLQQRAGVCTAGKGRQRSTSVGSAHSSAAVLAAAASRLAHLSGKAPSPTAGLGPSRFPTSPSNAGLDPLLSPGGAGGSPLAVGGSPLFGRGLGAQPTDAASRAAAVVAAAAAAAAAGYSSLAAATSSGLSSCAVLKSSKSANAPSPRARSQQSADSPSTSGAKRLASGRAGASTPGRRSTSQETPREVLGGDGALKPGPDAEACKEKETQSPSKEKDGEAETPAGGRKGSSVASAGAPEKLDKPGDNAEAARLQILASLFPRAETPVALGSKTPGPASGSLEPTAADGAPAHAGRETAGEEADDEHLRAFWSQELEISKVPQFLDDNPRGEGWLVVASALPACVARQDLLREKVRAHLAPQLEAATGQKQNPPPGFRDCLSTAMRNPLRAGTDSTRVENDGRRLSDTASAHHALLSNVLSSRPSSPKDASALAPSRQLSREERGDSQRPVCGEEGPGATGAQGAQGETNGTSGDGHAPPLKKRRTDEDFATAVSNRALTPPDDLLHVLPRLSSVERRRMRQLEQPVLSKERRQKVTQHLCASARNLIQCVQEMQLLGALPRAIAAAPEAPPNGLTNCRSAALDELRKAMLDLPPSALWSGLHAPEPFSSSRRQGSSLSPAVGLGRDGGDEAATAEEEDSERPDIFFHLAKESGDSALSETPPRGLSDRESPAPQGGVGSGLWAFPGGAGVETFSGTGSASAVSDVSPVAHRETSFSSSPIDAEAFWLGDDDSLLLSDSEEEGDAVEAFPFGPADPYSVLYSGSHEVSASRPPLADLAGAFAASEAAEGPAQGASDDACSPRLGASFPSFSAPRTLRQAFQEARATLPWRVPPHLNEEEAAAWLREALREQKKRETEFRNLRLFQLERKAIGAQLSLCGPRHVPAGQEVFAVETPGDGLRFLPLTAEEEDELQLLREQRRRDWENVEKAKQQLREVMCQKDLKAQRHVQARLQRLSERLVNRERRRAEDFRRLRELREQEVKRCEERKVQAAQEEKEREALKVEDATAAERERADRVSREREGERDKASEGALHAHPRGEDRGPSCLGATKSTVVSESEELSRSSSELSSDVPNSKPLPVSSTSLLQRQSAEVPTGGTQAAPSGLSAPHGLVGAADGASLPAPAEASNLLEKFSETAISSLSLSRGISTQEANGKAPEVAPCLKLTGSASFLGQSATPQGGASEAGDRRSSFLASSKIEANGGRAPPGERESGDDKVSRGSGGPVCDFSESRDNPGDSNVLSQPSKLNLNPVATLNADRQTANSIGSGRASEVSAGGTEASAVKATQGEESTQEGKENKKLKMVEVSAGASPVPLGAGGNQADLRPRAEGGKGECELSVSPNEGPRGGTGRDKAVTSTLHAESQGQNCGVPLAHALQRAPESSMCHPFEQLQPSQLQQLLQFQQTQRIEVPAPGAQGTHSLVAAPAGLRDDPLPPQLRSMQQQHTLVQLPAQGMQQPHLQALLQKQQLLRQQILQNALAQQQRQNRPR